MGSPPCADVVQLDCAARLTGSAACGPSAGEGVRAAVDSWLAIGSAPCGDGGPGPAAADAAPAWAEGTRSPPDVVRSAAPPPVDCPDLDGSAGAISAAGCSAAAGPADGAAGSVSAAGASAGGGALGGGAGATSGAGNSVGVGAAGGCTPGAGSPGGAGTGVSVDVGIVGTSVGACVGAVASAAAAAGTAAALALASTSTPSSAATTLPRGQRVGPGLRLRCSSVIPLPCTGAAAAHGGTPRSAGSRRALFAPRPASSTATPPAPLRVLRPLPRPGEASSR